MKDKKQDSANELNAAKPAHQSAVVDAICRDVSESSSRAESCTSDWLTASEAAEYLKVKPRTLLAWARRGTVKAYPLSGTRRRIWRFRREDLDGALLSRSVVRSSTPTVLSKERRLM